MSSPSSPSVSGNKDENVNQAAAQAASTVVAPNPLSTAGPGPDSSLGEQAFRGVETTGPDDGTRALQLFLNMNQPITSGPNPDEMPVGVVPMTSASVAGSSAITAGDVAISNTQTAALHALAENAQEVLKEMNQNSIKSANDRQDLRLEDQHTNDINQGIQAAEKKAEQAG